MTMIFGNINFAFNYINWSIYISENYVDRKNIYKDKLKMINLKQVFRQNAESNFQKELINFNNSI